MIIQFDEVNILEDYNIFRWHSFGLIINNSIYSVLN